MRSFRPDIPFSVAMKILIPVEKKVKGTVVKEFPDEKDAPIFYGSVKTFGGTESFENNIYTVYDTATVNTWYRPDITPDCMILMCDTNEKYEIITRPEDIERRHQFLQFRVRRIGGKA